MQFHLAESHPHALDAIAAPTVTSQPLAETADESLLFDLFHRVDGPTPTPTPVRPHTKPTSSKFSKQNKQKIVVIFLGDPATNSKNKLRAIRADAADRVNCQRHSIRPSCAVCAAGNGAGALLPSASSSSSSSIPTGNVRSIPPGHPPENPLGPTCIPQLICIQAARARSRWISSSKHAN